MQLEILSIHNYKMIQKKIVISLLFAVLMTVMGTDVFAQNDNPSNLTSSPYTRYGFGRLGTKGNAATRAMGDLGIALRTNLYTNMHNPASLTAIDTLTMIFDTAVDAELFSMKENGKRESNWNAGFSYMTFHFPLWNRFAGAIAYSPYSMVGYEYGNEVKVPIENPVISNDTLTYSNLYSGNGGLQHFQLALAWQPVKTRKQQLNLGAIVGYICGNVNHSGYAYISSGQANSTLVTRNFMVTGMDVEFGLQYSHLINASRSITVGATFSPSTNLHSTNDVVKFSGTDSVGESVTSRMTMKTPVKYGFGVSYQYDRRLTVLADYSFENWEKVSGFDSNLNKKDDAYHNITKFGVGMEYKPKMYAANYFKTCLYRAGVSYSSSYVNTNGNNNKELSVTCGVGLPTTKRSIFNISASYTHVAPSDSRLLSEDMLHLTLGITFNEIMFFRGRLR